MGIIFRAGIWGRIYKNSNTTGFPHLRTVFRHKKFETQKKKGQLVNHLLKIFIKIIIIK